MYTKACVHVPAFFILAVNETKLCSLDLGSLRGTLSARAARRQCC